MYPALLQFLAAILLAIASVAEAAPHTPEEIVLVNASQGSMDTHVRQLRDGSARGRRLAINNELRNAILDKHNTLRSTMPDSPCTAADMLQMSWDSDVANAAQDWADRCVFEHDLDGNRRNRWGENLALTSAKDDSISRINGLIQLWYDEVEHTEWFDGNTQVRAKSYSNARERCPSAFDSNTGQCMIGHFTQVVAANSHKLGCGVTVCNQGTLLVCKYSPAGNLGTSGGLVAPFQFGASCGSCESDCERNLCQTAPVTKCSDRLGTEINRFTVGNTPYTDCEGLVADHGCEFTQSNNKVCSRTCNECTPATKLGTEFCGTEGGRSGGSDGSGRSGSGSSSGLIGVNSCHKAATWHTIIPWLLIVMLWNFLAAAA